MKWLFTPDLLFLRDFDGELDGYIACLDVNFDIQETSMFGEHAPEVKPENLVDNQIMAADKTMGDLAKNARKAQWEIDTLSLARDVAQLGKLLSETVKNEHSKRTERVLHLRNQNAIGASLVAQYMDANLALHSGPLRDQHNLIDKVGHVSNMFKLFYGIIHGM